MSERFGLEQAPRTSNASNQSGRSPTSSPPNDQSHRGRRNYRGGNSPGNHRGKQGKQGSPYSGNQPNNYRINRSSQGSPVRNGMEHDHVASNFSTFSQPAQRGTPEHRLWSGDPTPLLHSTGAALNGVPTANIQQDRSSASQSPQHHPRTPPTHNQSPKRNGDNSSPKTPSGQNTRGGRTPWSPGPLSPDRSTPVKVGSKRIIPPQESESTSPNVAPGQEEIVWDISDVYKAAGILAYARKPSQSPNGPEKLVGLFVLERRGNDRVLTFPGGKIEPIDQRNPLQTAIREFNEETRGVFADLCESLKTQFVERFPNNCCYLTSSKYVMTAIEVPYYCDVAERLSKGSVVEDRSERLLWIELDQLCKRSKGIRQTDVGGTSYKWYTFANLVLGNDVFRRLLAAVTGSQLPSSTSASPVSPYIFTPITSPPKTTAAASPESPIVSDPVKDLMKDLAAVKL